MKRTCLILLSLIIILLSGGCKASQQEPTLIATPLILTATPTPTPSTDTLSQPDTFESAPLADELYSFISTPRLLQAITDLTGIEAYSGWRNSASQGEREAIQYLRTNLEALEYLGGLGLEVQSEKFNVFLSTELWETHLYLTTAGQTVEVPADGLRGPRDEIAQALRFDSDGALNDTVPNPVMVEGAVLLIRSQAEMEALSPVEVKNKLVFLDYAVIDRTLVGVPLAARLISELIDKDPAGLVLVTSFSNKLNESHGTFIGDVSVLNWVTTPANPPTLYVRLEDLAPAGIQQWADLNNIEAVRLVWDADVFSPGTSYNLIARIPGLDSSRAVLLTAHIDSANSPGALDDAAGSAILLEIARIFNEAHYQPATDIYLVWFGSQALGFYGAYDFVARHQALLDQTLAMLQVDSLSYPLDGITADLNLVTWSYGRLGNEKLTWPDYLAETVRNHEVIVHPENLYELESDNTAFAAFDVPNAHLIYMNRLQMEALGGLHYAAHSHDPYDTVELVSQQADILEQMAQVVLTAALAVSTRQPDLRVTPPPSHQALFIASHTEAVHMQPPAFTDLGMTLAMAGFDVDMIPYGQPVTAADLAKASLVIVLPVLDYPSPAGDAGQYDTAWDPAEIAALTAYVQDGGFLIVTNSAHRLKYGNWTQDPNEDWSDMNALSTEFGVTFYGRVLNGKQARIVTRLPLTERTATLTMAENNGVAFYLDQISDRNRPPKEQSTQIDPQAKALVLAQVGQDPAVALIEVGEAGGQVLVLADVGILNTDWNEAPANLHFWQALARYSLSDR